MRWMKDLDGFGRNNFIYDYIIAYIMIMNTYIERKYHNLIFSSEISTNQIMQLFQSTKYLLCVQRYSVNSNILSYGEKMRKDQISFSFVGISKFEIYSLNCKNATKLRCKFTPDYK
ncbi:Hypothetical_protein [Hexamita inflata]|uniref:Hypothetical_protein n=1 Tax=Hexamita inflata TaxID=28002 RepID=A0AA86Q7F8_9EUKA|nr:Hypothetical protein HINF_LOCUS41375 [Hexamita inflata]